MTQSLAYFYKNALRVLNVRYKVMEHFIHCHVSLEINNGQIKSLDASDISYSLSKRMPKWMGVNGMLTAGEVLPQCSREASVSGWWITPLVTRSYFICKHVSQSQQWPVTLNPTADMPLLTECSNQRLKSG